MAFDKKSKEFSSYGNEKIPFRSHGTGDLFAATFAGAYTLGKGLPEALRIAADYTAECIRITYEDPERCGYGVRFETALPYLMKRAGIL